MITRYRPAPLRCGDSPRSPRISGPLLDRSAQPLALRDRHPRGGATGGVRPRRSEANGKLTDDRLGEPSADIRARVEIAREVQRRHQRQVDAAVQRRNACTYSAGTSVGPAEVREHCPLDDAGKSLCLHPAICQAGLRAAMTQLGMSARAFRRILKLARTIVVWEGVPAIQTNHVAEAIQYRPRRQL